MEIATLGGAKVLGRDDIGSLAPDMAADFVAFDLGRVGFAGALPGHAEMDEDDILAVLGRPVRPVDDPEQGDVGDLVAGLLHDLAGRRLLDRFVAIDEAAR